MKKKRAIAKRRPKPAPPPKPSSDLVPVGELRPWKRNPRKNEKAVAKVAEAIREFGFVRPIIANLHPECLHEIIVGHTAFRAATEVLGMTEVPVRWVHLEPDRAHAAAVADNKLGEISAWDYPELAGLLQENAIDRRLFEQAGFTASELDRLLAAHGPEQAGLDAVVAPAANPTTRAGDLYLLGRHRLLCGDSTKAEDVARALGGAKPFLMVTDPPYGVDYDPDWRNTAFVDTGGRKVGKVTNDDRADWTPVWRNAPCTVAYVWHAPGPLSCIVCSSIETAGFEVKQQIIWVKSHFVVSRSHYHGRHEPLWYAVRKGKTAQFTGGRQQTTVWEIGKEALDRNVESTHSTQKPVECMARPMRNHPGDVFEPFGGSGTTIIAAETLGRACYALEISPAYCDAIVARWEALTGEKARRERAAAA